MRRPTSGWEFGTQFARRTQEPGRRLTETTRQPNAITPVVDVIFGHDAQGFRDQNIYKSYMYIYIYIRNKTATTASKLLNDIKERSRNREREREKWHHCRLLMKLYQWEMEMWGVEEARLVLALHSSAFKWRKPCEWSLFGRTRTSHWFFNYLKSRQWVFASL